MTLIKTLISAGYGSAREAFRAFSRIHALSPEVGGGALVNG